MFTKLLAIASLIAIASTPSAFAQIEELKKPEKGIFRLTGTQWVRDIKDNPSVTHFYRPYMARPDSTLHSSVYSRCGDSAISCDFTYSHDDGLVLWVDDNDIFTTSITIGVRFTGVGTLLHRVEFGDDPHNEFSFTHDDQQYTLMDVENDIDSRYITKTTSFGQTYRVKNDLNGFKSAEFNIPITLVGEKEYRGNIDAEFNKTTTHVNAAILYPRWVPNDVRGPKAKYVHIPNGIHGTLNVETEDFTLHGAMGTNLGTEEDFKR